MRLSTWQADFLRHVTRSHQHMLLRTITDHPDRRCGWESMVLDGDQLTGGPRQDGEGLTLSAYSVANGPATSG